MVHGSKRKVFAVACVCDGIGSLAMSELAAELVTDGIRNWFLGMEHRIGKIALKELLDDLEGTIVELNELVYEYQEQEHIAIGCTMSLLLIIDSEFFVFHVGDSRVYRIGDNMYQMTVDEVLNKNREGQMKSYLSNFMGKSIELWLNKTRGMVQAGDLFLLGTDGLFKKLIYEDIGKMLGKIRTNKELERLNDNIIQLVMERGERDNISSILLQL